MTTPIHVISGDFEIGTWTGEGLIPNTTMKYKGTTIQLKDLESVSMLEIIQEKDLKSKLGLGIIGALALGPIGAVAGLIFGGNTQYVLFEARLKNGKSFKATVTRDKWPVFLSFC